MIYSILHFLADKFWVFFLFWFVILHHSYDYGKGHSYLDMLFRFELVKMCRNEFKLRENKSTKDEIYNFFEHFVYWFKMAYSGGAYLCLYLGMLGIILKIIFKLIEKGN